MKQHPTPRPLRMALLALGLLAGAALQAPAHAAGGLGQFTQGLVAPADITGGVVFGKNGEVIPLDAAGKALSPCVMSQANSSTSPNALPECPRGGDAKAEDETLPAAKGMAVTCTGYTTIWVGGVPVKIWTPPGCTPP